MATEKNKKGQGRDAQFQLLKHLAADIALLRTDVATIYAAYIDHRHSVCDAANVGTAPSTSAQAAEATASTVTLTSTTATITSE